MPRPAKPARASRQTRPTSRPGRHNFETSFGKAAGDVSPLAKLGSKLGIDDSRMASPFDTAPIVSPEDLDESHRSIGTVAMELGVQREELEDYIMDRQVGLMAVNAANQEEPTYYLPEASYRRTVAHFSD